jgi:Low-density lipoprotein receptor domain class A
MRRRFEEVSSESSSFALTCTCTSIFLIFFIRCDCESNCMFGEDEEGCSSCEHAGLNRCPGELKFINTTWVCDGLPGCSNGRDEFAALCSPKAKWLLSGTWTVPDCPDLQFQCKGRLCIDLSYVCDGYPECSDGTDEGRNCTKLSQQRTLNQVINLSSFAFQVNRVKTTTAARMCVFLRRKLRSASATLVMTPLMKGGSVLYIVVLLFLCLRDEFCSQLSSNSYGSYHCSCTEGHSLELGRRTCKVHLHRIQRQSRRQGDR